MTMLLLALLVGVIAGLRAFTAPAIASWAAALGLLNLDGSWLAFLGYRFTPYVFTVLALGEFVTDQLPSTPSRKVPMQFAPRLLSGALSGAAIGIPSGQLVGGLVAGVVGAVIGTLGGAEVRGRLAASFGKDRSAALIEDAVAVLGGALILGAL
ncbi:DUF4126 domain-containing protein [Methylobacterium sp. J-070]|uniref:DUF4126 domain-containing protein n=1 Tax=Methylobacterium sp. J-070 TaxID=2836650 RepID=UPI001FB8E127|nr:DUF4126 domain-containing protein [Methylobacterium sp. J-070]MCJ2048724.1 DUF4126 domain-containing protein [Methylobacterium sp. J-070]